MPQRRLARRKRHGLESGWFAVKENREPERKSEKGRFESASMELDRNGLLLSGDNLENRAQQTGEHQLDHAGACHRVGGSAGTLRCGATMGMPAVGARTYLRHGYHGGGICERTGAECVVQNGGLGLLRPLGESAGADLSAILGAVVRAFRSSHRAS